MQVIEYNFILGIYSLTTVTWAERKQRLSNVSSLFTQTATQAVYDHIVVPLGSAYAIHFRIG